MSRVSKIPTSYLLILFILFLIAKAIGVGLFWFLPLEGVSLKRSYSFTPEYIRVDLARVFAFNKHPSKSTLVDSKREITINIDSMILKGLYGNKKRGFAIVAKKGDEKKTTIVGVGESFEGYRLKAIELNRVIFTKDAKEFVLKLQKGRDFKKAPSRNTLDVYQQENIHQVETDDVKYFAKHPRQIWKNISIQERKKDGKIEGFEVKWIKPGSKFAQLGLKKGDLIIKANNKRLQSYKDALDIYKKIERLDELSIVILRNNQEKELLYEINR
ncbi:General secretion pathway protein C [hydrothermal vent metagenome]|uniref:General secretion pathway protein C n=1 Tax=hydrothermal vent metagenome TaxID=652676 RepID=A0A1W1BKG2_9ZZZZ